MYKKVISNYFRKELVFEKNKFYKQNYMKIKKIKMYIS